MWASSTKLDISCSFSIASNPWGATKYFQNSIRFGDPPGISDSGKKLAKAGNTVLSTNSYIIDKVFIEKNDAFTRLVDSEVNFDIWIEAHIFFDGERKAHYCLIADLLGMKRDAFHIGVSMEIDLPTVGHHPESSNVSMLVNVPELIQAPEMSGFVVVPSMIRLHRLHDGDCCVGNSEGDFGEANLCVRTFFEVLGRRPGAILTA